MRAYRRARARKNDHDCEPIHICSGVGSARSEGDTGDFRGPVTGAAGTRHFEPGGVSFGDCQRPNQRRCVASRCSPWALSLIPNRQRFPKSVVFCRAKCGGDKMQDLKKMAAKLLETARKLPPGAGKVFYEVRVDPLTGEHIYTDRTGTRAAILQKRQEA
jgi:hypothetical protein